MTYKKIKNEAFFFVTATKLLEAMAVIGLNESKDEKSGNFFAHIIIPSLVLGSISCELILKALVVKEQDLKGESYKINELYHQVDKPTKEVIADAVISMMRIHDVSYSNLDFRTDLDNLAYVFADWRCFLQNIRCFHENFFNALFDVLVECFLRDY